MPDSRSVCQSRRETLFSPVNVTGHIVWGETAADQDHLSWKYTGTGLVINEVALTFWAGLYEAWTCRKPLPISSLVHGAAVSGCAYVIDYLLIPKRFTPGFEKRLSGRSLFIIYCGIAASLIVTSRAAREVLRDDSIPLHVERMNGHDDGSPR